MLQPDLAARLAELPLRCIQQEYPNKTAHTIEADGDARLSPRQLHPSFYGCFDWHSSVHGHWMLVRLLKTVKDLPNEDAIRKTLAESFRQEALAAEASYFERYKLSKTFERTYGWAWLLKLDEELMDWNDPSAKQWHTNMQPLTKVVTQLWTAYLPKQTYPNRTGVHPNTAFGLVFALDWARTARATAFEQLIRQRAREYYLSLPAVAAIQEPDGGDFLSPSLEVADLMRRVLPTAEFPGWFERYFTEEGFRNLLQPPIVSDRTDYQIVHLDGLSFSRAWCLSGVARSLPASNPRKAAMRKAARALIDRTMPHLAEGNYGGEHWLASFAVYALSQQD
jgi:hypothetical protein